jgi:hypothetical protein
MVIDYNVLVDAIKFYSSKGFRYIETPWFVQKHISAITAPVGGSFDTHDFSFVGSAEQGFLQLYDNLTEECYMSAGPCFRREADELHYPQFFKLELFSKQRLDFSCIAQQFLGGSIVNTEEGKDIEINGIEVGSYGTRTYKNMCWSYGTGVALPRYTLASNKSF